MNILFRAIAKHNHRQSTYFYRSNTPRRQFWPPTYVYKRANNPARCSMLAWHVLDALYLDGRYGKGWGRAPVLIVRLVDIMLELLVYARLYVCTCVCVVVSIPHHHVWQCECVLAYLFWCVIGAWIGFRHTQTSARTHYRLFSGLTSVACKHTETRISLRENCPCTHHIIINCTDTCMPSFDAVPHSQPPTKRTHSCTPNNIPAYSSHARVWRALQNLIR